MPDTSENVEKSLNSTNPSSTSPASEATPETQEQVGGDILIEILDPKDVPAAIDVARSRQISVNLETKKRRVRVSYFLMCVINGQPPKTFTAYSKRDLIRLVQELRKREDHQYMYIVRGGEPGKMYKARRGGILLKFPVAKERITIPFTEHLDHLKDGWLGD